MIGRLRPQQQWYRSEDGECNNSSHGQERHPSWSELIFDLVIVASFSALGKGLKKDLNNENSIIAFSAPVLYILLFAPIFNHWNVVDGYINRFGLQGLSGGLTIYSHTIVIGFMNVSVMLMASGDSEDAKWDSFWLYCMCNLAANALATATMVRVFYETEYKWFSVNQILYHAVKALLWLSVAQISIHQNPYTTGFVWLLLVIMDRYRIPIYLLIGQYTRALYEVKTIPLHVDLVMERCSLLVIIAIGECFMSTVGEDITQMNKEKVVQVLLAAAHAFLLKITFFDVLDCPGEHAAKHALKSSVTQGVSWTFSHLWAVVGITLSAHILEIDTDEEEGITDLIPLPVRSLYGASIAITFISFWFISCTHTPAHESTVSIQQRTILVFVVAGLLVLVTVAYPWRNQLLLEFILLLCFSCFLGAEYLLRYVYIVDHAASNSTSHHHHNNNNTASSSSSTTTHSGFKPSAAELTTYQRIEDGTSNSKQFHYDSGVVHLHNDHD